MLDVLLEIKLRFINSLDFSNECEVMAPGNLRNKLLRNWHIGGLAVMGRGELGNKLLPNWHILRPEVLPGGKFDSCCWWLVLVWHQVQVYTRRGSRSKITKCDVRAGVVALLSKVTKCDLRRGFSEGARKVLKIPCLRFYSGRRGDAIEHTPQQYGFTG